MALINGFEPAAQARTAAQDVFDAAERVAQTSLLKMNILGTKVPTIIDAPLSENAAIQKDLQDVFRAAPRTESGIRARMRLARPPASLFPSLLLGGHPGLGAGEYGARGNDAGGRAHHAAIQGVPHTVAMAKGLLDGYTALIKKAKDQGGAARHRRARRAPRARLPDGDAQPDMVKAVKAMNDPGSAVYDVRWPGIPLPATRRCPTRSISTRWCKAATTACTSWSPMKPAAAITRRRSRWSTKWTASTRISATPRRWMRARTRWGRLRSAR